MTLKITFDIARELLSKPMTGPAELAEIAAKFPELRESVGGHINATPMLSDWISRNVGQPRGAGTSDLPSAPRYPVAGEPGRRDRPLPEWERRLAEKEAERLHRARRAAEDELQSLVRGKSLVESEAEIVRQNLGQAKAALEAEHERIREAEGRISEQVGARAELDDIVKIVRTNLGDLEYALEQESLAYAQAENRLAQVQREQHSLER
ncbi:hypothetical protein GCM10009786_08630 [Leucobacter alluvii]|uniref:Leucine rich repeat variant domain-containing protein n=1 Tax=Leucobacter alluvii TaxID=340321 RepID=A0ABN3B3R9_9MICO